MTEIAITGSTGQLGGRIAQRLSEAGVAQRLVVREESRAPQLDRASVVQAEYADTEAVRRALDGVETALMVSAAENVDRLAEHRSFVEAAAAAGVQHLVYTSFAGAAADATFTLARDHWHTEEHLRASGIAFTFCATTRMPTSSRS